MNGDVDSAHRSFSQKLQESLRGTRNQRTQFEFSTVIPASLHKIPKGPDPTRCPELRGFTDYNDYLGIVAALVMLSASAGRADWRPVCRKQRSIQSESYEIHQESSSPLTRPQGIIALC